MLTIIFWGIHNLPWLRVLIIHRVISAQLLAGKDAANARGLLALQSCASVTIQRTFGHIADIANLPPFRKASLVVGVRARQCCNWQAIFHHGLPAKGA